MSISNTPEWAALVAHVAEIEKTHLRELLQDAGRCAALTASCEGLFLDYSRQRVTAATMDHLHALAARAGLADRIRAMATGERINVTEGRAVLHAALRAPRGAPPLVVDGADVHAQVHAVRDRIAAFAERVRSGTHVGVTGKPLTNVVSIGIGGWGGVPPPPPAPRARAPRLRAPLTALPPPPPRARQLPRR